MFNKEINLNGHYIDISSPEEIEYKIFYARNEWNEIEGARIETFQSIIRD